MSGRVVLFQPPTDGAYLPLALLAVARLPRAAGHDVRIVDANVDSDWARRLRELLPGALCLGVSVLTGRAILGALEATRIARVAAPALPVVWGGWHASIMPEQCLDRADVAVIGQGEETFAELVARIESKQRLDGCPGTASRGRDGVVRRAGPRRFADVDGFPAMDYGLLDIQLYFRRKGRRQIEYLSSYGCSFSCTFCADPLVVNQRWTALPAARVVEELAELQRRYAIEDVIFADDHFFNSPKRVREICERLSRGVAPPRWFATARADVFARHSAEFIDLLAPAGCRTLFFGIESGDETRRARLGKRVARRDLLRIARELDRRGIETNFTYIVGLPAETPEHLRATIAESTALKLACRHSLTKFFYYSPYPGTELYQEARQQGMVHEKELEEWGRVGDHDAHKPWIDPRHRKRIEMVSFYQTHMNARAEPEEGRRARWLPRRIARLRGRTLWFGMPVEATLARVWRGIRHKRTLPAPESPAEHREPQRLVEGESPDITIVIPTRNRAAWLLEAVDAVVAQQFDGDFDVVVVDDGSIDGTAERMAHRRWPRPVRLIRQEHAGPAAARNRGVKEAAGRIVVLLDDDCLPEAGWLERLVAATRRARAAVGTTRLATQGSSLVSAFSTRVWSDGLRGNAFISCNAAFSREILLQNPFDEMITRPGCEDSELAERLRVNAGVVFVRADEAVVRHRSKSTLAGLLRTAFDYGRGWSYFRKKSGRPLPLWQPFGMVAGLFVFFLGMRRYRDAGTGRALIFAALNRLMLAFAAAGAVVGYRGRQTRRTPLVREQIA